MESLDRKAQKKAYYNWKVAERRRTIKRKCIEYKGGKCERCGYNKCDDALHFHHRDPNEKDFGIASGCTKSWERIRPELDKCILLCGNCHAEEHFKIAQEKVKQQEQEVRQFIKERTFTEKVTINCTMCNTDFSLSVKYVIPGKTKFCSKSCAQESKEKIDWPSDEELKQLIWTIPLLPLSKKLGVSDNAIRHRCKTHNIERPPKGYWATSRHRKTIKKKDGIKFQPSREKINWPSDEELGKLVMQMPLTQLAKELGVSDRAIRKRCGRRNIERPPQGYWSVHKGN